MPIVKYNVRTLVANMLITKHTEANTAPATVTAWQPYLSTKILDIGPEEKVLLFGKLLDK